MKYALLVIDMNRGSFDPNSRGGLLYQQKGKLVCCINDLAAEFRKRHLPVVWVTQRWKADWSDTQILQRKRGDSTFMEYKNGWHLLPELDARIDVDHLVIKTGYSAFFGTTLHEKLQEMSVSSVIIAGVNTYACVRCTTIDAYQYGYDPIIWPKDGIASSLSQFEEDTIRYMVGDQPGRGSIVEGLLTGGEIVNIFDRLDEEMAIRSALSE